jgi:hypothetical protein
VEPITAEAIGDLPPWWPLEMDVDGAIPFARARRSRGGATIDGQRHGSHVRGLAARGRWRGRKIRPPLKTRRTPYPPGELTSPPTAPSRRSVSQQGTRVLQTPPDAGARPWARARSRGSCFSRLFGSSVAHNGAHRRSKIEGANLLLNLGVGNRTIESRIQQGTAMCVVCLFVALGGRGRPGKNWSDSPGEKSGGG